MRSWEEMVSALLLARDGVNVLSGLVRQEPVWFTIHCLGRYAH